LGTSYHDIKATILLRIRENIWPPSANLPGEIDLAKEFGCARATVNRAMRELVDEGILERKRKAGTKVKPSPTRRAMFSIPIVREEVANTGAKYRYVLIERAVIPVPRWLRARMDIAKDQPTLHLRCMHYADGNPYQFEDRWINLAAVPTAADFDFEDIGPNEWLVREVPFTEGELVFTATNATNEIANLLKSVDGAAVFTVERTTWLDKMSVTYARLYFAKDHKMTTRF
jgi:GntR family histidine utilization transcriptional repressor